MKRLYFLCALIILITSACEEKKLEPITASLGKPGKIEILTKEAIPGGVAITYRIPNTEDILSVKAEYNLSDGRPYQSTSSYYDNELIISGFSDTREHEAKVYVINRAQEKSDPVTITFTPLEAAFLQVAKTMEIDSDFGGARFFWKNPNNEPLIFEFFTQDSLGRMQAMRVINSSLDSMKVSLRGYEPIARRFGAVIRDHWENHSDTIFPPQTIVPLFEEKINKRGMSVMRLSSDANFTNWEGMDAYIIDDDKDTFGHSPNSSIPAPFTIDFGVKVKLSRVVFFNRLFNSSYYSWGNPRTFDIYICRGTPSISGDWSQWEKVMECEQVKPSNTPGTTMTDDDNAQALAGWEFEFDLSLPAVRYIRFVIKSTWENTSYSHPCELDFYGKVDNE